MFFKVITFYTLTEGFYGVDNLNLLCNVKINVYRAKGNCLRKS